LAVGISRQHSDRRINAAQEQERGDAYHSPLQHSLSRGGAYRIIVLHLLVEAVEHEYSLSARLAGRVHRDQTLLSSSIGCKGGRNILGKMKTERLVCLCLRRFAGRLHF